MTEPLKPTRVIVDRTVLVELLDDSRSWAIGIDGDVERADRIFAMLQEVASGERVELYADDWPGSE